MMCQYCGQNHAENKFVFVYMGMEYEMHLCGECTKKFQEYANAVRRQYWGNQPVISPFRGPVPGEEYRKRDVHANQFPYDAGEAVRKRRQMNALKNQLTYAVAQEQYEKAAKLRDEIRDAEKEVNHNA